MGRYSDFLNAKRNQLGARDYAYGAEKAKFFNYTNPPQFPITDAEIRRRENMLLTARSELSAFINSEYPDSYMDKLPPDTRADLGIITSNQEGRNNLSAGLMNYMYQLLNSTDQSIYLEFLMRMDRGESRDMFLGVVDRGSVIDAATIATYAATAAVFVATGAGLYAAAAAPSAAVGAAAEASTIAASGAAIEGGSLAGASGLLGEGVTVAGFAEAGAAATTASTSGGLFSGLGSLSGVLAGAEATIGAAALSEGKKYVEGLLQPKKEVVQNPIQQVVETPRQASNTGLIIGASVLGLLYFLI